MKTNHFNICPTCMHQKTCVLTAQKDEVWECSEYDESYDGNYSTNKSSNTGLLDQEKAMA